jgi:glycosyltransferase involved in cell wall biosynthesis
MLNQKVSVVIPVYNSEKFLKESLESVINQTYDNIEIICIDDGSADNSLKILKQFKDKIIIISQENHGLASAVNSGISKMNGNWMKWLSPDDILYPHAVEVLVEKSKELSENTILYSNWQMIDENGKKLRDFHESNYNNLSNFEFNVRLLNGQQINVNTALIPSSLFEKGCLLRTLNDTTAIDYDFFLRSGIHYNTNFHLIEKNLLKYRMHKSQTSHKNITNSIRNLEKIKNEILSKLDEKTRFNYTTLLKKYSKEKKIKRKIMYVGLNIISKLLPNIFADRILIFYLNKIRIHR